LPEASMVPPPCSWTVQVTAVESPGAVPETVALKAAVPPTVTLAFLGVTATATDDSTVTVAVARTVESVVLVATTWKVPLVWGAVYWPVALTVPPPGSMTDHVTVAGWGELAPETWALKSTVPPREVVAAGGITASEMSEVTPGMSATSPLQLKVKTARKAGKIARKRRLDGRIQGRCAGTGGPGKRQNRMPT